MFQEGSFHSVKSGSGSAWKKGSEPLPFPSYRFQPASSPFGGVPVLNAVHSPNLFDVVFSVAMPFVTFRRFVPHLFLRVPPESQRFQFPPVGRGVPAHPDEAADHFDMNAVHADGAFHAFFKYDLVSEAKRRYAGAAKERQKTKKIFCENRFRFKNIKKRTLSRRSPSDFVTWDVSLQKRGYSPNRSVSYRTSS